MCVCVWGGGGGGGRGGFGGEDRARVWGGRFPPYPPVDETLVSHLVITVQVLREGGGCTPLYHSFLRQKRNILSFAPFNNV